MCLLSCAMEDEGNEGLGQTILVFVAGDRWLGGLSIRQIGTTRFFLFFHLESACSTILIHLITYTSVATLYFAKLSKTS